MKKTRRTSRVGENVRDALVQILRTDIRDFDFGWSSISEVEVAPDLHYARVYVTGLKEEDTQKVVEELRKVAGQVRHHLARRINLRYTPELDFRYDETAMRALRVETILREVLPPKEATQDEETTSSESHREPTTDN
ncbi:MAG TPA: 30S ribosome-binding factor RbfA [Thermoanaerobaculia bacterium]|jgi:ribosome-binding factor A|nr:30S ribosome-binding factor RbfA [Thermoanaerobaculia bacterium]